MPWRGALPSGIPVQEEAAGGFGVLASGPLASCERSPDSSSPPGHHCPPHALVPWGCSQQGHHRPSFLLQDHVHDVDKTDHEALQTSCSSARGGGDRREGEREKGQEKGDRGEASGCYPGAFGSGKVPCSEGYSVVTVC